MILLGIVGKYTHKKAFTMGKIALDPYLFFKGDAREALEFYKSIFGGELIIQTYGEAGSKEEAKKDDVMHATLDATDFKLMASDIDEASEKAKKVTLCLGGSDEAKLRGYFDGLSDGIEVKYPLKKEFWGDIFGSLTDKYGIEWMVNIEASKQAE